jgi:hypothetical protein
MDDFDRWDRVDHSTTLGPFQLVTPDFARARRAWRKKRNGPERRTPELDAKVATLTTKAPARGPPAAG